MDNKPMRNGCKRGVAKPLIPPFQSKHEYELACYGIEFTDEELERYRETIKRKMMEGPEAFDFREHGPRSDTRLKEAAKNAPPPKPFSSDEDVMLKASGDDDFRVPVFHRFRE